MTSTSPSLARSDAYESPRIECADVVDRAHPEVALVAGPRGIAASAPSREADARGDRPVPGLSERRTALFLDRLEDETPRRPTRGTNTTEYFIDDEALVYHETLQTIVHMNKTAASIWRHCDGRTIEQIANAVAGNFDVPFRQAVDDTRSVVSLLVTGGLLRHGGNT